MLALGRKPVVQYVVEELASNGIERILFITSQGKSSIAAHFDIDENLDSKSDISNLNKAFEKKGLNITAEEVTKRGGGKIKTMNIYS